MTEYFLPSHVHFCCRGDAVVFLDLRQDAYTLVNGAAATALRALFSAQDAPKPEGASADALSELVHGGLLTSDRNGARRIAAANFAPATEALVDPEARPVVRVTLDHVRRFVASCVLASVRLGRYPLEATVSTVERRKKGRRPFDVAKARELTVIFQKLRPFFPRDCLCLYDSLALIEFLARYGVFATWVFGIKLEPWAAHCWLQHDRFVFNDDVEEAASYTPIMAI